MVIQYSAVAKLEQLIATLTLDAAGETNAAIAYALALKLDEAQHSDSGAVAMAIGGIAKELRAVIDAICESASDRQEFVSDLFS